MVEILQKKRPKMFVREVELPVSEDKILGTGVDVTNLPEGFLACPQCKKWKFECWVYLDAHRVELGCLGCGHSMRLLFPLDIDLLRFGGAGRFTCLRRKNGHLLHDKLGMVVIHNSGTISFGCEACKTECNINVRKTESNLILAD